MVRARAARRAGAAVRRAWLLRASGHDSFARGAKVLQPGPGVRSRIQSRGGHPLVPGGGAPRSGVRDGALGHRVCVGPAHQLPHRAAAGRRAGMERAEAGPGECRGRFAGSMMDLRPWNQWTLEGEAQPGTEEVLATLDAVLKLNVNHPFANHLYIHAVEASPHPERADAAAERLLGLQPGLAHNVHMPSHIDIRRGRWQKSIET